MMLGWNREMILQGKQHGPSGLLCTLLCPVALFSSDISVHKWLCFHQSAPLAEEESSFRPVCAALLAQTSPISLLDR